MNFKINSRSLFTVILKLKNENFKTRDSSPLIERLLAGVEDQYQVRVKSDGYQSSGLFQNPFYCLMGKFHRLMD